MDPGRAQTRDWRGFGQHVFLLQITGDRVYEPHGVPDATLRWIVSAFKELFISEPVSLGQPASGPGNQPRQ